MKSSVLFVIIGFLIQVESRSKEERTRIPRTHSNQQKSRSARNAREEQNSISGIPAIFDLQRRALSV
jgi:hypothetical protein